MMEITISIYTLCLILTFMVSICALIIGIRPGALHGHDLPKCHCSPCDPAGGGMNHPRHRGVEDQVAALIQGRPGSLEPEPNVLGVSAQSYDEVITKPPAVCLEHHIDAWVDSRITDC